MPGAGGRRKTSSRRQNDTVFMTQSVPEGASCAVLCDNGQYLTPLCHLVLNSKLNRPCRAVQAVPSDNLWLFLILQ